MLGNAQGVSSVVAGMAGKGYTGWSDEWSDADPGIVPHPTASQRHSTTYHYMTVYQFAQSQV